VRFGGNRLTITGACCLFITVTALLAGAAAASVVVDYDRRVNFATFKRPPGVRSRSSTPWEPRVKHTIDSQLAARGWTKMDADSDAIVSTLLITRPEQSLLGPLHLTIPPRQCAR